jgi:hypothetical protein
MSGLGAAIIEETKSLEMLEDRILKGDAIIAEMDKAISEKESIESLESKIQSAEAINRAISENARYRAAASKVESLDKDYEKATDAITALESKKADLLSSAKFPIDGLEFGEDVLLYRGIPLSQISESEKIKVGVAVSMALNPRLKVIRIMDGSLLDSGSMAAIEEMARDKDFQIWIERVDESGKVGIYIEDGEIGAGKAEG